MVKHPGELLGLVGDRIHDVAGWVMDKADVAVEYVDRNGGVTGVVGVQYVKAQNVAVEVYQHIDDRIDNFLQIGRDNNGR